MRGIAGIFSNEADPDLGQRFRRMMPQRPWAGSYVNEEMGFWIGYTLQEDFSTLPEPEWNEEHSVCMFFVGEDITGEAEIRSLGPGGQEFEQSYLVRLYEEQGPGFIRALNGRFFGVVVDLRDKSVVLFNDRFGLERIYFYQAGGATYFASEAKALLRAIPEARKLDPNGIAEVFSCGCVLQNRSLFAGIALVPGGSVWHFRRGRGLQRDRYFMPAEWEQQEALESTDYYDRLRQTWIRILPRYLRDPKRTAVSLTGGKDSRMIMAWANLPPWSLPSYTFGSMYRDSQDVQLARQIAALCRQPHQVITLDRGFLSDFPKLAEKTVYLTDGAMDVSGAAELYVNGLARQIAPIRLTGNYGQEILRSAVAFRPMPLDSGLFIPEFASLIKEAERTYLRETVGNPLSFIVFKQVPWHHRNRLSLELSQLIARSPYLDNDLIALAYQKPLGIEADDNLQLRLIAEGCPAMALFDTDRGLLLGSSSLAAGAGRILKELTFKAEYAYDYGMPQILARVDAFFKHMHPEHLLLGRHKYYHFRVWYRDQLSGYVREMLLDPRSLNRSFLEKRRLEEMVNSHIRGTGNFTLEIHKLLTAELIHRLFLD